MKINTVSNTFLFETNLWSIWKKSDQVSKNDKVCPLNDTDKRKECCGHLLVVVVLLDFQFVVVVVVVGVVSGPLPQLSAGEIQRNVNVLYS